MVWSLLNQGRIGLGKKARKRKRDQRRNVKADGLDSKGKQLKCNSARPLWPLSQHLALRALGANTLCHVLQFLCILLPRPFCISDVLVSIDTTVDHWFCSPFLCTDIQPVGVSEFRHEKHTHSIFSP